MRKELQEILKAAKDLDQKRLALDREAKKIAEEVDELKAQAIGLMQKMGINSISLAEVTATVQEKEKPFIVDYGLLEKYIVENKAIDLLQKRLTESAVKLRWADGVAIPGVGVITETKLQLR